jgi:hypothetical protein
VWLGTTLPHRLPLRIASANGPNAPDPRARIDRVDTHIPKLPENTLQAFCFELDRSTAPLPRREGPPL